MAGLAGPVCVRFVPNYDRTMELEAPGDNKGMLGVRFVSIASQSRTFQSSWRRRGRGGG